MCEIKNILDGINVRLDTGEENIKTLKNIAIWASLVVQWLRIHLPMQETWV